MQINIIQKALILISIPLVVQVVSIAALVKLQRGGASAQHWAVHTKEVIAKVHETHLRALESLSGVHGLISANDPASAALCRSARVQVPRQIEELRALVADNPAQQPRLDVLGAGAHALVSWVDSEQALVAAGRQALASARFEGGADILRGLNASLDEILHAEERLDRERTQALARATRQQLWTLLAGGTAIVVSTLLLAVLFLRGIMGRLAVLSDNARRCRDGEPLNAPLLGNDEITDVDRALHDMAESLGRQKQDNEMFVYSVSHDLRSPLVNLEGFSDELSLSCGQLQALFDRPDVPAAVRTRGLELAKNDIGESIHYIHAAVGRLAGIIDALLRLSRAGRVEYDCGSTDVSAIVSRIVAALHDTISEKKAVVGVGELPQAWGDPTAIEQIFANLIGNAVLYLDPARPGRIEVGTTADVIPGKPSGLRAYYVKDNGLGIPAAYHHRVFTAFNRLHADVAQGEGIGLAMVHRMVERHGGRIWLESEIGEGSTFFVALPMPSGTDAAAEPDGRSSRTGEPRGDDSQCRPSHS
jgi:signal transduction histidine kinase